VGCPARRGATVGNSTSELSNFGKAVILLLPLGRHSMLWNELGSSLDDDGDKQLLSVKTCRDFSRVL
jgi:hypothetical protein